MSELILKKDSKNPNLHTIHFSTGGPVPAVLAGLWSSKYGLKAIKAYEERPQPKPMAYDKHAKKITDEEEADLFEQVKRDVEAKNNGEETKEKTKNSVRTKRVRKGSDNRS